MSKYYHVYYCFRRLIHHMIWKWQLRVIFTMKMTKSKIFHKFNAIEKFIKKFIKNIHQKHLSKEFIQKMLKQLVEKVFTLKIIEKRKRKQNFSTKQTKKHLDILVFRSSASLKADGGKFIKLSQFSDIIKQIWPLCYCWE